jgi:hypothetical protein
MSPIFGVDLTESVLDTGRGHPIEVNGAILPTWRI